MQSIKPFIASSGIWQSDNFDHFPLAVYRYDENKDGESITLYLSASIVFPDNLPDKVILNLLDETESPLSSKTFDFTTFNPDNPREGLVPIKQQLRFRDFDAIQARDFKNFTYFFHLDIKPSDYEYFQQDTKLTYILKIENDSSIELDTLNTSILVTKK